MRLIFIVIALLLAACGLYAGYWFAVSDRIAGRVDAWSDARVADGWIVSRERMRVGGFPGAHHVTLTGLEIAAPPAEGGWAAAIGAVRLDAAAPWRLGDWTLRPHGDLRLRLQGGEQASLSAVDALARLETGPAGVTRFHAAADGLSILSVTAPLQAAGAIRMDGVREDGAWIVQFEGRDARLAETAFGDARAAFGADIALLSLDIAAQEDGLAALAAGFAGLADAGELRVHAARLEWGAALLDGEGALGVDADGRLRGAFTIAVADPAAFLGALAGAGAMDPRQANLALAAVTLFPHDNQDRVLLPLNFTNGETRLGPVAIGPAPLLTRRSAAPAPAPEAVTPPAPENP